MTESEKNGALFRASFLERNLKEGNLIKTGEVLALKDIKPKTLFALDNTYYEMLISTEHYCKFEDCVRRDFYTTKTYKKAEIIQWAK